MLYLRKINSPFVRSTTTFFVIKNLSKEKNLSVSTLMYPFRQSSMYFKYLVSVTAGGANIPEGTFSIFSLFYNRLWLICSL